MDPEDKDPPADKYEVGYKRPPKSSQFTSTRQPARRHRVNKAGPNVVLDILNEEIQIGRNGRKVRMTSFEVSVRKLVEKAVKEKHLDNANVFLGLCKKYKSIKHSPGPQRGGILMIPCDWDQDEWMSMFNDYGPPPWPGPRSGIVEAKNAGPTSESPFSELGPSPQRSHALVGVDPTRPIGYCNPPCTSQFKVGTSGNLKGRPSRAKTQEAIVTRIASEMGSILDGNRREKQTVVELVLRVIREKAHEGNRKAFRIQCQWLSDFGYEPLAGNYGYLLISEPEPFDEWERKTAEQQRQYRETSGSVGAEGSRRGAT